MRARSPPAPRRAPAPPRAAKRPRAMRPATPRVDGGDDDDGAARVVYAASPAGGGGSAPPVRRRPSDAAARLGCTAAAAAASGDAGDALLEELLVGLNGGASQGDGRGSGSGRPVPAPALSAGATTPCGASQQQPGDTSRRLSDRLRGSAGSAGAAAPRSAARARAAAAAGHGRGAAAGRRRAALLSALSEVEAMAGHSSVDRDRDRDRDRGGAQPAAAVPPRAAATRLAAAGVFADDDDDVDATARDLDAALVAEMEALEARAAARAAAAAGAGPAVAAPGSPPPRAVDVGPAPAWPTVEAEAAAAPPLPTPTPPDAAPTPAATVAALAGLGTLPGPAPHPARYVVLEVESTGDGFDLRLLADPVGGAGGESPPPPPLFLRVRGPWAETAPAPGDVVAVVDPTADVAGPRGEPAASVGAGVDGAAPASAPALLLAPDRLLSGTRVAGALSCPRAAALDELFGGEPGARATAGTLAHEVLGAALAGGDPAAAAAAAVARSADRLVEVGLTHAAASAAAGAAAGTAAAFAGAYVRGGAPTARVEDASDPRSVAALAAVVDVEEVVWAPRAGIKGVLDATVAARFGSGGDGGARARAVVSRAPPRPLPALEVVPLEFKTGRRHDSHRAQVSLYLALLAARYGAPASRGLLLYADGRPPTAVRAHAGEAASLLAVRNAVAASLAPGAALPPVLPVGGRRACGTCFQRAACGVAAAARRGGAAGNALAAPPAWGDDTLVPIPPAAASTVGAWLAALDAEDAAATSRRAEIWTLPGAAREALGRAVAGLVLDGVVRDGEGGWLVTFRRGVEVEQAAGASSPSPPSSSSSPAAFVPPPLDAVALIPGDFAVLGVDGAHACVARATVAAATATTLTLSLDRAPRTDLAPPGAPMWRVDRDEPGAGAARQRRWLASLFARGGAAAGRVRRLLVDLAPPAPPTPGPRQAAMAAGAAKALARLNRGQAAFAARVLGEPDYALCLGLPGTGKTAALAAVAAAAAAAGRRVLIGAYTNAAVDNVVARLAADGVTAMLRVGRASSVSPAARAFMPGGSMRPETGPDELARLVATVPIVAASVLSADAALLRAAPPFDLVLLDEAGQMTAPAAVGALLRGRCWALVGDHYQLPPLAAGGGGGDGAAPESLFKRLAEAHPQARRVRGGERPWRARARVPTRPPPHSIRPSSA